MRKRVRERKRIRERKRVRERVSRRIGGNPKKYLACQPHHHRPLCLTATAITTTAATPNPAAPR